LRILDDYGITHWRAKKRPKLNKNIARLRLKWCRARQNWSWTDWSKLIFLDEMSYERGASQAIEWVFGTPAQKWHPDFVTKKAKGKGLRIMIWAAISGTERSNLGLMIRDETRAKKGYSS